MNSLYQFHINAPSSLARLRLLSILVVCLRRLNPRRLDGIFNLKSVLFYASKMVPYYCMGLLLSKEKLAKVNGTYGKNSQVDVSGNYG